MTLHYSTVAPLHSIDSTLLNFGSCSLYLTLHYSTLALLHSISLHIILPFIYVTLLDSTLIYHDCTSLYLTTLLYHDSISLYLTLHALLYIGSTSLHIILQWLYVTLLDSTLHYTMALLHCT